MQYIGIVGLGYCYYYIKTKGDNERKKEIKNLLNIKEAKKIFSNEYLSINDTCIKDKDKLKIIEQIDKMALSVEENTKAELLFNSKTSIDSAYIMGNNKQYISISIQTLVNKYLGKSTGSTSYPNNTGMGNLYHEIGHIYYTERRGKIGTLYLTNLGLGMCVGLYSKGKYVMWGLSYLSINQGIYQCAKIKEEKDCDMYTAEKGYAEDLIEYFKDAVESNKKLREECMLNRMLITKKGNNLKDFEHPFLTKRIKYLEEYLDKRDH